MPKVPEKVEEIHHRYIEGDITLVEMQRQIDNAMSDLSVEDFWLMLSNY